MTEKEVLNLIKHRKDTDTYFVQCGNYGFHGTDRDKVVEDVVSRMCLMPDCCHERTEQGGRLSYLCLEHYEESSEEEAELSFARESDFKLTERDWSIEALQNSIGAHTKCQS